MIEKFLYLAVALIISGIIVAIDFNPAGSLVFTGIGIGILAFIRGTATEKINPF